MGRRLPKVTDNESYNTLYHNILNHCKVDNISLEDYVCELTVKYNNEHDAYLNERLQNEHLRSEIAALRKKLQKLMKQ